jgi:hypothetical protein
MDVVSFIKKILFGEKQPKRFSDSQRFESMNQSIHSDLNRFESERIDLNRSESMNQSIESSKSTVTSSEKEEKSTISIDKESLKVGVAAGYISRSLISIEEGIERIENSMPSKEWISMNVTSKIEQVQQAIYILREILMNHERNEEKRFEVLLEAINKLKTIAPSLPEPIKTEILSTAASLKSATLTPKMQQILDILKERREISYQELAEKLGITTDGLRGILSRMVKVCDEIQRFEKDGKGWIRIKAIQSDLNRSESLNQSSRLEIKEQKEENKKSEDLSDMP